MTAVVEPVTIHHDTVTVAVEHVELLLGVGHPTAGFWAELRRRLELLDDALLDQYSQDIGPTGVLLSAAVTQPLLRDKVESGITAYGTTFERLRLLRRRIGLGVPPLARAGAMLSALSVLCQDVRRLRSRIQDLAQEAWASTPD